MRLFKSDLTKIKELAELARSTYDTGEIINENYLAWEYNLNPSGKAIVFLAVNEDVIISQYVVLPRNFIIDNEYVTGSLSLNTITHPDHRGKGYFSGLAELTYSECQKSEIDFTIGFPNKNSIASFVKKLKFSNLGHLPLMLKVVNPWKVLFSFLFKRKAISEQELKFNCILPKTSRLDFNTDLDKYNIFWGKFKKRNVITTDRSTEFIQWRYVDIPIRKYHLFKIESDGKIESIIIFRVKNIFGVNCGIIVDLLSLNKNKSVGQLIRHLQKNQLDLIISTVPNNSIESECLKSAGFFKVPEFLMFKKLNVIIRIHSKNISSSVSDFKRWFLTFGDYDIF